MNHLVENRESEFSLSTFQNTFQPTFNKAISSLNFEFLLNIEGLEIQVYIDFHRGLV